MGKQDPPQSGWVWSCLHYPGFLRGLQAEGHLEGGTRTSDQALWLEREEQVAWRPEGWWG